MVRLAGTSVAVRSDDGLGVAGPARSGAGRPTWARAARGVVVALCVVLVVVLVRGLLAAAGLAPDMRNPRALGMPAGLRVVVQRAVGLADRGFWVARRGGVMIASGGGISSVFSQSGVRVRVKGGVVGLRLVGVGYGALSAPGGAGRGAGGVG